MAMCQQQQQHIHRILNQPPVQQHRRRQQILINKIFISTIFKPTYSSQHLSLSLSLFLLFVFPVCLFISISSHILCLFFFSFFEVGGLRSDNTKLFVLVSFSTLNIYFCIYLYISSIYIFEKRKQ